MKLYSLLGVIVIVGTVMIVVILKNQKKQQPRGTAQQPGIKTRSQAELVRILEEENSESEKWRAVSELHDPDMIMRVLMSPLRDEDRNSKFIMNERLACKIEDPAMAKKIILESPKHFHDAYKHFAQIITNDKDLEEILLKMKTGNYQSFLEKITDEEILMNLARNASWIDIRFDAAEKTGNHDLMDEIIEEDPAKFHNRLEKVHDPDVLRRITENEQLPDKVKFEAAVVLKDEALIRSFGKRMGWDYDCRTLLKNHKYQLSDDTLMGIITDPDIDSFARQDAAGKIKDTSLLDEIAEQCDDENVRLEAYKKSEKYHLILKENHIYLPDLESEESEVRQKTADKLISLAETDPEVLLPIWDYLKKKIEEPVTSTRSNWYDRDEAGYYNESGIGKKFPDKPGTEKMP